MRWKTDAINVLDRLSTAETMYEIRSQVVTGDTFIITGVNRALAYLVRVCQTDKDVQMSLVAKYKQRFK